ncbi:origin recognition complex subunit 4 [Pleosporales sp. CAS-2024a]
MDDAPPSKRRKLDTPKRIGSRPAAKGAAKRASGRLATPSTAHAAGSAAGDSKTEPPAATRTMAITTRRTAASDMDVYDDIEGALSAEPASRPSHRSSRAASRQGTRSIPDELQHSPTTPKRPRGRPRRATSASRSALKTLVHGFKHDADGETETPDELAAEPVTPSKRGKVTTTRAVSPAFHHEQDTIELASIAPHRTRSKFRPTRKTVPSARKKAALADDEAAAVESPLKSAPAKKRKPLAERMTVPETEHELAVRPPPSSRKPKQTAGARRRLNRTDNTSNGDDGLHAEDGAKDAGDEDAMSVDGNSVMESVLDPTEPSPFNRPASAQKKAVAPLIYGNIPAGRKLHLLKTIVLERIAAKRSSPLVNLDAEYRSVHQIIEQTVTAGEGNSMLLIGARGSGKTALVNKVLSEVAKDHAGQYHVVRLNGFVHTDDKIALREIWRQLGKEMEIEEDGSGPGKNYADTLTTLLALLSHPSEHTGEHTDQVAKAVIFVMDEFDLFAQHPRQTLLYNLFDIAQSRKAPIAVLGLTTRIDVTNSLEKRVKSRFSHRYVHLSLAKTFTAFQDMCKAGLIIEAEHLSVEERGILAGGAKRAQTNGTSMNHDVLTEWNANVNKLFASSPFLVHHLAPHFYRHKSIPSVLNTFLLPTATLSPTTPFLPTTLLSAPDSKLFLIPALSTLALSLLIAAARLDIIHDTDTCNFNMAYDEYVTLASKARIQSAAGGLSASGSVTKVWGKDVARSEWDRLVELGLVMPVVMGPPGGFGMVRCDVALEEVGAVLGAEKGVDRYLERWCKAI